MVMLAAAGVAGVGQDGASDLSTRATPIEGLLDSLNGPPLFSGFRAFREIDLTSNDFEDPRGFVVVGYVGADPADEGRKRIRYSTVADSAAIHDEMTPELTPLSAPFGVIGLGVMPVLCSKVYRTDTTVAGVTWYAGYP